MFVEQNHCQTLILECPFRETQISNDRQECLSNNKKIMAELKITKRHLPHWTLEGSVYFVTFRAARGMVFDEVEQRVVLEHIKQGHGTFYYCYAAIVMPDHVHLLIQPNEGVALSRVMHGLKGVSAHKINLHRSTLGQVWQDESYDRIVRNDAEFRNELNYMYNNPIRKGLTEEPEKYVGWNLNERE